MNAPFGRTPINHRKESPSHSSYADASADDASVASQESAAGPQSVISNRMRQPQSALLRLPEDTQRAIAAWVAIRTLETPLYDIIPGDPFDWNPALEVPYNSSLVLPEDLPSADRILYSMVNTYAVFQPGFQRLFAGIWLMSTSAGAAQATN